MSDRLGLLSAAGAPLRRDEALQRGATQMKNRLGALCAPLLPVAGSSPSALRAAPSANSLAGAAPAPSATAAAAPSEVVLNTRTQSWELGKHYTYTLALTTTVARGDGTTSCDLDLAGNLEIIPVVVTGE